MSVAGPTSRRQLSAIVLLGGLLLGTSAPARATDEVLEGTSGRLAWRAEYLQLDTRVLDGKARDSYRFVLVLKNVTREVLTFTSCEYSWSLLSIGTDVTSASFPHTLRPGQEIRMPLEAFLECFGGPGACRAPIGPHWVMVYTGHRGGGEPVREVVDVILPPKPGAKIVPIPKLAVRSDGAAAAPAAGLVPVELTSRLMIVRATAGEQEIALALDTASQFTVLTPETATRLGLGASAEIGRLPLAGIGTQTTDAPIVLIPSFRIGGYVVENLLAGIAPLFAGTAVVDGLLGGDFLDAFTITIDRRAKQLRLELNR